MRDENEGDDGEFALELGLGWGGGANWLYIPEAIFNGETNH